MLDKMPGDVWQKHANLRALYGYMFVHPGKKLMFMGGEIGQWREWNHDWQLDWEVLGDPKHAGLQRWVRDLNRVYHEQPSLWDADFDPAGFSWIDCNDHEHSIIALTRRNLTQTDSTIAVVNFTPVPRRGLPAWRAGRRRLRRVAQQRRRGLRRQQHRQPGPRRRRAKTLARLRMVDQADRPTSGISAPESEQVNLLIMRISNRLDLVAHVECRSAQFRSQTSTSRSACSSLEPKCMVRRGTNGVTNGILLDRVRGRLILPS
jgi:hypothetical protein